MNLVARSGCQLATLVLIVMVMGAHAAQAHRVAPLRLDPRNPHYFLFRGRPTVLIGSSEHYAAVSNAAFDYTRYLDAVEAAHLNAVRIFTGTFRESLNTQSTGQIGNTLAPEPREYLAPWSRSDKPGARDGLNRFDLSRWDSRFFQRLRNFVKEASDRSIVVEVALFTPFYSQFSGYSWSVSPLNVTNNVNNIGNVPGGKALSLQNGPLLAVQDALVRKIADELAGFDNVYYEICNEPFHILAVSLGWQKHIAKTLAQAESALQRRHLIAQELDPLPSIDAQPEAQKLLAPIPQASIFVIHNLPEPQMVVFNYALNKPLGYNENGFNGTADAPYRLQAWQYLMAGGAVAIGLDYSFTVGHEDGSFRLPPGEIGGGSQALRAQLGVLRTFMERLDLEHMRPAPEIVKSLEPMSGSAYTLAQQDAKTYVIYVSHGQRRKAKGMSDSQYSVDSNPTKSRLDVDLPRGAYSVSWIDTKTGKVARQKFVSAGGATQTLESPSYSEDIALEIQRHK